jgi:Mg-chelatase subunit ChlD
VNFMAARPMPGDQMGLVSFSSGAQVEVALGLMTGSHVGSLRSHINGLSPGGVTDTEDGLDAARQMFAASPDDMADQIAILVSDGGPTSPSAAQSAGQALCNENPRIQLNTVLISTGSGTQPDICNGGRDYPNVHPTELEGILFNILSGQQVRLVE